MLSKYYPTNMAASCLFAVRTTLKGLHLVSGQFLLSHGGKTPAACHRWQLRVCPAARLCSARTESRSSAEPPRKAGERKQQQQEEEEDDDEGPEYIPRRKAKNPMMKIGYAWMIGLPTGIIGFLLAKRQVDKNRLKQLKIRQRMKRSNEGEYEGSRYLHGKEDVNLER